MRTQNLVAKEKKQETLLMIRIGEINRQMALIKKKFVREKELLLVAIKDTINKIIAKRRAEFKKLWLKYIKISRSIENLQHKENCRLRYLERKGCCLNFREQFGAEAEGEEDSDQGDYGGDDHNEVGRADERLRCQSSRRN